MLFQVVNVKVIRNKQTNQSEGYGFIEFVNRAAAERVLQTYNGTPMPNCGQPFRLNWASAGEKRSDDTPDYTIFVGDLAVDVTDYMLQELFKALYPSCKGAKVVIDRLTGRTKGYGFVKFGDESEQLRAMTEMNGVVCSSRAMRIGPAANKNAGGNQQYSKGMYDIVVVFLNSLPWLSAKCQLLVCCFFLFPAFFRLLFLSFPPLCTYNSVMSWFHVPFLYDIQGPKHYFLVIQGFFLSARDEK